MFAKRVPLTDLELAHPRSTANLFGLPLHCQYGIGSPGFNAWRELAANSTVTAAVLSGETDAFPLLHHWRVLPGRPPVADEHADIEEAAAALGGGPAVRARLQALAAASSSLVMIWEHLPHPLGPWLADDPVGKAVSVEQQLLEITRFLRGRGLLHMDGHFDNMRVDGGRIYLTDFGLATSAGLELTDAEQDFVRRNAQHDTDYAVMRLVNWLVTEVCGVAVPANAAPVARDEYVMRSAAGDIPADVPPTVAAVLARHSRVAVRMNALYRRLFGGDLRAEYPGA
ncbi:hypothetical protein [Kribbella sp. NPDC048928]|uniref:hypothetical protein n=1 Tax=Kribbella sp. NPDC048928 TaxID=3364111 RepID=UPI00372477F5